MQINGFTNIFFEIDQNISKISPLDDVILNETQNWFG